MDVHFRRHLKLAVAVSLMCLWAFAAVERTPFLGDTFVLPLVAVFLQYSRRQWSQRLVWQWREGLFSLSFLVALFGTAWLVAKIVPEGSFKSVAYSPPVVFVVWAAFVYGLVRQATRLAQNGA
jgi:hypothetical protein